MEAAKQLLDTGKVNYLLVETSGLADVVPVALAFSMGELEDVTELDSIICVVDAENYFHTARQFMTTIEQIQCSDIVLLNKADLVDKTKLEHVKADIRKHLPNAQIIETVKSNAPLNLLLAVGRYDPEKQKEWKEQHEHDKDITATSCTTGPVDSDKVQEFLENLPENIYRAKGILCIAESEPGKGDELRITFQKVGKRTELEFSRPWEEGETKETTLVFIGKDLDPEWLQKKLDACSERRAK